MPSLPIELLQDKINREYSIKRIGLENLNEIKKLKSLSQLKKNEKKLNRSNNLLRNANEEDKNILTMNKIIKRYILNHVLKIKSAESFKLNHPY